MIYLVFGPPGSGKGTLSSLLSKRLDCTHISVGDLLRNEVLKGSQVGKEIDKQLAAGQLVDERISNQLVLDTLKKTSGTVLLDGYPRTQSQAVFLQSHVSITGIIKISIAEETVIRRITQRRICPKDGSIYHLSFKPPKKEGMCDRCGGKLLQRPDDTPETIRKRFVTYYQETKPALTFLQSFSLPEIVVSGDYDLLEHVDVIVDQIRSWQRVVESQ